jgi:alkyl sulfatase BDS1-like metallo-beta-lactamase superfamily hydrolase
VKLIIFALIPLILSIGISPVIPFSDAVEYSEICIDKVWIEKTEGKIACVTSSTADKLVQRGWGTILSDDVFDELPSENTPFELPPYPDQPEVNLDLIAANDYWSPPAVHKITDGVYSAVGFDLANSIMIEGDDGIIIIDTLSTYEKAKEVITEFRKITDKPVKAIIYTHGHLDHVHGTGAFLEEGEDIEIYAHESHVDFYINENSVLGPAATIRSGNAAGSFLPSEGPDRFDLGIFPPMSPGTISYAFPTQTFTDELEVEISGVKLKMVFVAGESSDQIYIWLPEKEVLLIGDNIYAIISNIYTLRGSVYRDPMNYVNALDKMIPLDAEYLVASHVKPVTGKENIKDILVSTRDATQYIYDQTIRGMNAGYTADELSHMIELPEELDNHPWLTKTRNQVSSHVKQIYYGNFGWYEGDPAFLTPVSLKEKSAKIVEGFGGIDATNASILKSINNGEYEWAAELGAYAVHSNPDNEDSKLLKAHALRVLGQRSDSFDIRHWSLTEARVLEGKLTIDPKAFTQTSPEQMAELPIEKIIRFLPTKLDPQKAAGMDTVLGISYSDLGLDFTFHVRNSILAVTDGAPSNPDMILTIDSDTHKLIVGGHLKVLDAIESGQAELDGNTDDLVEFLNLFDNVTVSTNAIG